MSNGSDLPAPPAPSEAATLVAHWKLDDTGGSAAADAIAPAAGGTWSGAPEFGLNPMVADGGRSASPSRASLIISGSASKLKTAAYGRSGVAQAVAVTAGVQQMIAARDSGLPGGGFTVDLLGDGIYAYTRKPGGGTGSSWWLGTDGSSGNRPGSPLARVSAGQAFRWLLTVDPGATPPTKFWLWKAGEAKPAVPLATSNNTAGLENNGSEECYGAYHGGAAPFKGVLDDVSAWSGAPGATELGGAALLAPTSITHTRLTTAGLRLPSLTYQASTYSLVGGEVWWDPANVTGTASDSNSGASKSAAVRSFAAAEAKASTTNAIVLAADAASAITYQSAPTVTPTKSGTGAEARMKLYGEPGRTVVLCHSDNADMIGALRGTWTWTVIDATKKIYQASPTFSDGDTAVTTVAGGEATGSNWVCGILEVPNGCLGLTHMMALPWVDKDHIGNTGDKMPDEGGYCGPWICFVGGKIQVRLQPPTSAYGSAWPADGLMGGLIDSAGNWQLPNQAPDNYRLHIMRYIAPGDWGNNCNSESFDFAENGVDWWHVKGINTDLAQGAVRYADNTGILFEQCSRFAIWHDCIIHGQTDRIEHKECFAISWDLRHVPWRTTKGGTGYYYQKLRSTTLYVPGPMSSKANWLYEDCVFHGHFDGLIFNNGSSKRLACRYLHCAMLNLFDDGWVQDTSGGANDMEFGYCYSWGSPWAAGGGSGASAANNTEYFVYHCIIDCRLPMFFLPTTSAYGGVKGICCNGMFTHSDDNARPRKMYYNTILVVPCSGKDLGRGACIATDLAGRNIVPSSWQHEVFNNIIWMKSHQRYDSLSNNNDCLVNRMSCQASAAGIHRFDYNLYHRGISGAVTPMFYEIQDSLNVNKQSFTSLVALRASAKFTLSASMYSDGTTGHEQHGVEEDPLLVSIPGYGNGLDYRPRSSGAISGAKNLTSTGWPATETFKNWKGALDPDGDGSEVGPRS
jgi:hypothetical protein